MLFEQKNQEISGYVKLQQTMEFRKDLLAAYPTQLW